MEDARGPRTARDNYFMRGDDESGQRAKERKREGSNVTTAPAEVTLADAQSDARPATRHEVQLAGADPIAGEQLFPLQSAAPIVEEFPRETHLNTQREHAEGG